MESHSHPALRPEIGPDGLARDSPVIAYTEKVIEEEQLQLKKYIQENYSKIRDVERELESLTLEMKLTAGPKKAALEYLRKKIEISTERIRAARLKEEQAKKAWEAAAQIVKDEEEAKQKLCDDLNRLVQESAATQYSRLEELKKRIESLNPSKISSDQKALQAMQQSQSPSQSQPNTEQSSSSTDNKAQENPNVNNNYSTKGDEKNQKSDMKEKKRVQNSSRGRGNSLILSKGRGNTGSGWTGAGFDVEPGA